MRGRQSDPITCCIIIILIAIITNITRSGGPPATQSYIESQKQAVSQIVDNQFCLNFAKSISGTVIYKEKIYQDCIGD